MSRLGVNLWNKPRKLLFLSGYAYPGETLTAPLGTTYAWTVGGAPRGTSRTLVLTVYDIGLFVTCSVDGKPCQTQLIWHPNQISAVKHFWWAAQGAYRIAPNGVTDANASIITTSPYNATIQRSGTQNGKAAYSSGADSCFWNGSEWRLSISYDDSMYEYVSATDSTFPWDAVFGGTTVTRQATIIGVLATDGETVAGWRDIISGDFVTASASNIALFETTDLATHSLKFDASDFFTIPSPPPQSSSVMRNVFNGKSNCYIFAGAKDTAPTGGDATHAVVSINRTSAAPKLGLVTRRTSFNTFSALASSGSDPAEIVSSTSNADYNVLTTEALFSSGSLSLRVNGNQTSTAAISTTPPNTTTSASYIGASSSTTTSNFNGYMTAIILAADNSPISDTDRSRIERFIGLLDGLNIPLV